MGRRAVSAGEQRHARAGAAVPWAVQPEALRPQKDHLLQTVDEPSCLAW